MITWNNKIQSYFLEEVKTFHNAMWARVQNDAASCDTHIGGRSVLPFILALLVVVCKGRDQL